MMKKDAGTTLILVGILIGLICFSDNVKAGAISGIGLCNNIIIPSLLPILITTSTIINSRGRRVIDRLLGGMTERVFKLPRQCTTAIIFGMIAGYPSGAVLTHNLYSSGVITEKDARRIMQFDFSGGMAFLITAVGTICYGSTKIGVLLFLSSTLSSIIIAIASAIKSDSPTTQISTQSYLSISNSLIEAVESTIRSLLTMCAYIILFSAILGALPLPSYIVPIVEITNGIAGASKNMPIDYASFFLTFGGLCVHFQLFGMLKDMGVKYSEFLINRLIGALLSFGATRTYLYFCPQTVNVFSNISTKTAVLNQVNTGLSIVLVLGCAIIILDVESKKSKLI